MSMFDRVIVEIPLPDAQADSVSEWQTKSFPDPFLINYKINAEGRLLQEYGHYEDRSDPNASGIMAIAGAMTFVAEGWEDINYHGIVNFYGNLGETWYEYNAKFTDGNLVSLTKVKQES